MDPFKQKMNWNKYNRELANRGSLTVYMGDDLASKWADCRKYRPASRGRPIVYPDQAILLGLVLQQVYRLPLRQTVGLMRSVLTLSAVSLPAPDPSTLCRRRRHLVLPLSTPVSLGPTFARLELTHPPANYLREGLGLKFGSPFSFGLGSRATEPGNMPAWRFSLMR